MIGLLAALAFAVPDRSAPPPVVPPEVFAYAELSDEALLPGVRLRHVRVPGLRRVTIEVHGWRGALTGPRSDAAVEAAAWLWESATRRRDGAALQAALTELEGAMWSEAGLLQFRLGLTVARDAWEPGVDLLGEVLLEPRFDPADVRRYRREERLWQTGSAAQDPTAVTAAALRFATYGPEHPFGERPRRASLRRLFPGPLRRAHQRLLAGPIEVLVVGDLPLEPVRAALREGLVGVGGGAPGPELSPPGELQEDLIGVAAPGSPQATLRVRLAAPPFHHPDQPAMSVLNEALGGAFFSRLNRSLREERGWTYGAWSEYGPGRVDGTLTLGVDVPVDRLGETLDEVERILDALASDGVTVEELENSVSGTIASWNQVLVTSGSSADFYAARLRTPETVGSARARVLAEQALTRAEVQAVARRWLTGPRVVVVVGDPGAVATQLAERGRVAEWITPAEAIAGDWTE